MNTLMLHLVQHGTIVGWVVIALAGVLAGTMPGVLAWLWNWSRSSRRRAGLGTLQANDVLRIERVQKTRALVDRRLAAATLGAAFAAVGMLAAAECAIARGTDCLRQRDFSCTQDLPSHSHFVIRAAALASIVPGARGAGLALLGDALARRAPDDRGAANDLAVVDRIQGRCDRAVGMWLQHGAFEQAARLADECHRPVDAARAWYALGEYTRASDSLLRGRGEADPEFEARVHLLAHRYPLVAAAARRASDGILASRDVSDAARRRRESLDCIGLWADARAGEAMAIARLRARFEIDRRAAPAPMQCLVLLEDLLGNAERIATHYRVRGGMSAENLDRAGVFDHRSRWLHFLDLALLGEAEPNAPELAQLPTWTAEELVAAPESFLNSNEPALLVSIAHIDGESTAARPRSLTAADAATNAAAVAVAMDNTAEAQRWLALDRTSETRLTDDSDEQAETRMRRLEIEVGLAVERHDDSSATIAVAALRRDGVVPSRIALLESLQHGYLGNMGELTHALSASDAPDATLWALAGGTDGAVLAAYLEQHDTAVGATAVSLAVRHVRTGRAQILEWLRWRDIHHCVQECSLAAAAVGAQARAQTAYVLGAREDGNRYAATAARISTALLLRDVAVPRAVLEHIGEQPVPRLFGMLR